jgi:hypothetical protein
MLKVFIIGILLVFVIDLRVNAQTKDSAAGFATDSITPPPPIDTTKKIGIWKKLGSDPKTAMICSAVIPGLGQALNKKYWKVPIVYAGLGAMAYFIITNQQSYNQFLGALKDSTNSLNKIYTKTDLVNGENYYARYRNLSIIGAAFIYMLNIIDANVDAQMRRFDVSDNLSFHFTPSLTPTPTGGYTFQPGFTFIKRF